MKPCDEQILEWADEYFHRKGSWPTSASGTIANSGGEQLPPVTVQKILEWADAHFGRIGK